jgi:Uma2 family endonuclease
MEMSVRPVKAAPPAHELPDTREQHARIRKAVREVRILDPGLIDAFIRERQQRGIDGPDETWEGVYTVPPIANNRHQTFVGFLTGILFNVVTLEGRGQVQPGANVSDRREGWEHKFRGPDIVVALNDCKAVDYGTHWMGGPDFLVEVQSPGDETEEKIPFYSDLKVRELLVVHRDTRALRLYRHNGRKLAPGKPSAHAGGKWLVSRVVPLAFRRAGSDEAPALEISRTDGQAGTWTV